NMSLKLINTDVNAKVKLMIFGISSIATRQKVTNELKDFHPSRVVLIKLCSTTNSQIAEVDFDSFDDEQDVVEKMNNREIVGSVIHAFIDGNMMEYQIQVPQMKHSRKTKKGRQKIDKSGLTTGGPAEKIDEVCILKCSLCKKIASERNSPQTKEE
ncbi:MAG: hypothetical protein EZS28_012098, partial [Streblomastix strix]